MSAPDGLKVVLMLRADAERVVAGPTEQARRYGSYLEEQGASVTLWADASPPPGRYDVGHLFNLDWPVETAWHYKLARRCCDRVVLSTIHHREQWMEGLHHAARRGLAGLVGSRLPLQVFEGLRGAWLAGTRPSLWPEGARQLLGVRRRQTGLLAEVDMMLVLATGEQASLRDEFGTDGPSAFVPNGASASDGELPRGLPDEFLLCVGRIEMRKNQLMLLDAAARLDLPVVLAGPVNTHHRALGRELRRRTEESSGVIWLGGLDWSSALNLYRRALCHVLPSWCEVVPLVDLEAARAGCRVVTTARGYTSEYLGDRAGYWDPATGVSGLASQISVQLSAAAPPAHGQPDLTWERAGEALVEAYRRVLESPATSA